MDYGWVLKRAWEITWKFKALWVLGILASCSSGGGGGGHGGSSSGTGYQYGGETDPRFLQFQRWIESIPEETWILIAVIGVLVILVLSAIALVLGILGQAGLIAGFNQVETNGTVTLGEAWRIGKANFWRLLGVRAVFWAAGIIAGLLIAAVAITTVLGTFGIGLICLIPILCLSEMTAWGGAETWIASFRRIASRTIVSAGSLPSRRLQETMAPAATSDGDTRMPRSVLLRTTITLPSWSDSKNRRSARCIG